MYLQQDNTLPTARVERLAGFLMAEQTTSEQAFRNALTAFGTALAAIEFPLGSPVEGYDVENIREQIADWMIPPDSRRNNSLAFDIARERA